MNIPWTFVRQLTVTSLAGDQIDQVFPLIQAAMPKVSLDQWRDFARSRITAAPETSGIKSVVTEQDYIAGLGIYRVEDDLCHGPTLIADHFMALDLFNRKAVVQALAEFLESLGRQHGCCAVHMHIQDQVGRWEGPSDCTISILRDRGHAVESLRLCKVLSTEA